MMSLWTGVLKKSSRAKIREGSLGSVTAMKSDCIGAMGMSFESAVLMKSGWTRILGRSLRAESPIESD